MPPHSLSKFITIAIISTLAIIGASLHLVHHQPQGASPQHQPDHATKHSSTSNPWHHVTIKSGDTLSTLFERWSLGLSLARTISTLPAATPYLTSLKPNITLSIQLKNNQLQTLRYPINAAQTLIITHADSTYQAHIQSLPVTTGIAYRSGTITSTLTDAAKKNNVPHSIFSQFTSIYATQVNFNRDIHPGDSFHIMYTEKFIDGRKAYPGNILIAELTHHKKNANSDSLYPKQHAALLHP